MKYKKIKLICIPNPIPTIKIIIINIYIYNEQRVFDRFNGN